jgi:chromosome segregation ATPase
MGNPTYVYVPRTANVLRERERHIGLLEAELDDKNQWLANSQRDLAEMTRQYAKVERELEESNRWAGDLNRDLEEHRARVAELQAELAAEQESGRQTVAGYEAKVAELEADIQSKIKWALDVEAALIIEIKKQTAALVEAVAALDRTDNELKERTEWALRLDKEKAELAQQLELFHASRWVKLGRKVGLGPGAPAS